MAAISTPRREGSYPMKRMGPSAALPLLVSALVGGCGEAHGLWLAIESEVDGVDALHLTVIGEHELLLRDQPVPEDGTPPALPGELRLQADGRGEQLRFVARASRAGRAVAWGVALGRIEPHAVTRARLTLAARALPDADCDGIPDEVDGCPSTADADQADEDGDGKTDACQAPRCPGNLLANGEFEGGVGGWFAFGGELSWANDETHSGCGAARVCNSSSAGDSFYLNLVDPEDQLPAPAENETYRLEGWVRAEIGEAQTVRPTLREVADQGNYREIVRGTGVGGSGQWHVVSVEHAVTTGGLRVVEPYFTSVEAPAGGCFLLDDVCLTRTTASSP